MEVKILQSEKNVLELELVGSDSSLAQLISERLNQDKDVEFSSFKLEHPLLAHPKLFVRTKKGDASKLVLEKIDEIKKELADFRNQFTEISK